MITIIDYGVGNLGSLANLFDRLSMPYIISGKPEVISRAEALLLPGVGAAGEGMKNLRDQKLDTVLREKISAGVSFLGICLGMQVLFDQSEEGNTLCLGVMRGSVRRFRMTVKVPQIGWNQVYYPKAIPDNPLWAGIPQGSEYYFVNSYICAPDDPSVVIGTTVYDESLVSAIAAKNGVATQFHPEKSGAAGMQFIKNFVEAYL